MVLLLRSPTFARKAKKLLKKQPQLATNLQQTLQLLATDPSLEQLKTHKLKGELQDSYACRLSYELRIIFKWVEADGEQAILLQSIGSHDEVY